MKKTAKILFTILLLAVIAVLAVSCVDGDTHEHTPGREVIESETLADCADGGYYYLVKYCTECGDELFREEKMLAPTEHTPKEAVRENEVAAKCIEDGSFDLSVYCALCDKKLSSNHTAVSKLGHDYVDGVCTRCGQGEEIIGPEKDVYTRIDSDTIEFGSYPQSKVIDSDLISTLTSKAGTLPTISNPQNWTSYGYYASGKLSDYMWYMDITEGSEKYRGVYFVGYRPFKYKDSGFEGNTKQDDNGYYAGTVYWFKYEPISWTIVEESDGKVLLLCDMIIDSQAYQDIDEERFGEYYIPETDFYANNYAESTIRKWINESFYNTAFTEFQKAIIETTNVDNSAYSTGCDSNPYACGNTNDKIFLPSYREITNSNYGFSSSSSKYDTARRIDTTDYAQSQGALGSFSNAGASANRTGYFWLRSPYYSRSGNARYVSSGGYVHGDDGVGGDSSYVYFNYNGVVPALWIHL